jgi:hypothetical protein
LVAFLAQRRLEDRHRGLPLLFRHLAEPYAAAFKYPASAQQSAFYLPAGVPQNAELVWTNRLRIREGETLYWSSRILRGHQAGGIPDPGGTIQVLLERAHLDEPSPTRLVPVYWRGRMLGINHRLSKVHPGRGTAYEAYDVGRFVEATDGGITLEVETSQTLGINRETYRILYDRIMHIRLL